MLQIALQYGEETRRELEALGFKPWQVYAKQGIKRATPQETVEAGDSEIYLARRSLKPNMFLTTPDGLQLVLAWDEDAEEALKAAEFSSRTVYIKSFYSTGGTSQEQSEAGNAEFRTMQHPPEQYLTVSYWGAGAV